MLKRSVFFMGRVIGEARNKLPAVACGGLFVPVPFQRLNAAASRVLGQSFCRAVTQEGTRAICDFRPVQRLVSPVAVAVVWLWV